MHQYQSNIHNPIKFHAITILYCMYYTKTIATQHLLTKCQHRITPYIVCTDTNNQMIWTQQRCNAAFQLLFITSLHQHPTTIPALNHTKQGYTFQWLTNYFLFHQARPVFTHILENPTLCSELHHTKIHPTLRIFVLWYNKNEENKCTTPVQPPPMILTDPHWRMLIIYWIQNLH